MRAWRGFLFRPLDDANVYSQAFAISWEQPGSTLQTLRLAATTKAVLHETLLSGHIDPCGHFMGARSTLPPSTTHARLDAAERSRRQ